DVREDDREQVVRRDVVVDAGVPTALAGAAKEPLARRRRADHPLTAQPAAHEPAAEHVALAARPPLAVVPRLRLLPLPRRDDAALLVDRVAHEVVDGLPTPRRVPPVRRDGSLL